MAKKLIRAIRENPLNKY